MSVDLVRPPSFGSPVGRFGERPDVSLDRVSVKNNFSLGGPITFREIVISMTIHRPEAVFDESDSDYADWCALILPGAMFAMRYGWTGTSGNDMINGNGLADRNNRVDGQRTLLFVVTSYTFTIGNDGSIAFVIKAHESSDSMLNHLSFGDLDVFDFPAPVGSEDTDVYVSNQSVNNSPYSVTTEPGRGILKKTQDQFDRLKVYEVKKHGRFFKVQDILDDVFAPLFEKALRNIGYSTVRFRVGNFNGKVGKAKEEFGGELGDRSIGEFMVPEQFVKKSLADMRRLGTQLNVFSFFSQIISFVSDQRSWVGGLTQAEREQALQRAGNDAKKARIEEGKMLADRQSPPDIKVKTNTTTENGKQVASIYLVDMRGFYSGIDFSDRLDPKTSRASILEKLDKYNIPLITFKSGLSYILNNEFGVEQDQTVQAVFISRAVDPSRYEVAHTTHEARAADTIDPRKNIFSSAIKGSVSTLGNFAFDTFHMVWIEFGVRRWDGTFFVTAKEDVIDKDGFVSNISFVSTGDDPLNTQGVLRANQRQN